MRRPLSLALVLFCVGLVLTLYCLARIEPWAAGAAAGLIVLWIGATGIDVDRRRPR